MAPQSMNRRTGQQMDPMGNLANPLIRRTSNLLIELDNDYETLRDQIIHPMFEEYPRSSMPLELFQDFLVRLETMVGEQIVKTARVYEMCAEVLGFQNRFVQAYFETEREDVAYDTGGFYFRFFRLSEEEGNAPNINEENLRVRYTFGRGDGLMRIESNLLDNDDPILSSYYTDYGIFEFDWTRRLFRIQTNINPLERHILRWEGLDARRTRQAEQQKVMIKQQFLEFYAAMEMIQEVMTLQYQMLSACFGALVIAKSAPPDEFHKRKFKLCRGLIVLARNEFMEYFMDLEEESVIHPFEEQQETDLLRRLQNPRGNQRRAEDTDEEERNVRRRTENRNPRIIRAFADNTPLRTVDLRTYFPDTFSESTVVQVSEFMYKKVLEKNEPENIIPQEADPQDPIFGEQYMTTLLNDSSFVRKFARMALKCT